MKGAGFDALSAASATQAEATAQQLVAQGIPATTVKPPDGSFYSTYVINGQDVYVNAGTDPSKSGDLSANAQSYLAAQSDPYMSAEAKATFTLDGSPVVGGTGGSSQGGSSANVGAGGATAGSTGGVPAADTALALSQRNSIAAVTALFKSYGLDTLVPQIIDYVKQGYDDTTVGLLLQDSPEFKQRFAGNDARRRNGLAVLSPAEYLSAEAAYRQALSSSGLPASFYDSQSDFAGFIGDDKSPAEIKRRADKAMQFVLDSDPSYLKAFQDYYGAGPGDIAAYFLDGAKNEALLDKRAAAARLGATAVQQGLQAPGVGRAEKFADLGLSDSQVQQAYGDAAGVLPGEQAIAHRFGQQYDQTDAEDEFLGGMASAKRKRQKLNNAEEALFSGASGVTSQSLNGNTSGAY